MVEVTVERKEGVPKVVACGRTFCRRAPTAWHICTAVARATAVSRALVAFFHYSVVEPLILLG